MLPEHHHPGQATEELFPGLGPDPRLPGSFPVCAGRPGTPGKAPRQDWYHSRNSPSHQQISGHRPSKIKHGVSLAQVLRLAQAQAFLQGVRVLQCKVTMDLQHEVRDTGTSFWAPTTPVCASWQGSTSPSRQQEQAWRAGQQGPVVPTSVQGLYTADVPLPTSDQQLLQAGKSRRKQR